MSDVREDVLRLEGVSKTYNPGSPAAVEVLRGLDLSVARGEVVALVAPSGAGKSTLLRMLAGLESITGGEIRIGPRVVNDVPPKERDIAMVFQNYALYPHMSVYRNLAYGLRQRRTPRAEIDRRVRETAELLEIHGLLDRKPGQLSGGQRQRVAMGRAIVREPKVFLFDEPLSNLDAKLRADMRIELKRLHERVGRTMVYVTHDQVEAMTLADKIVVLNKGRIEQVGSPLELYRHPVNRFVAGFIGSPQMNFLPVQAAGVAAGGVTVTLPGGDRLTVPVRPDGVAPGAKLTLGLRPEDLSDQGQGEARIIGQTLVVDGGLTIAW